MTATDIQRVEAAVVDGVPEAVGSAVGPVSSGARLPDQAAMQRWRQIVEALFEALPLVGVHERDLAAGGTPVVISIGAWASIGLYGTSGGPAVLVRASSPGLSTAVIHLDGTDGDVIADILEAVTHIRSRRRRLSQNRVTEEAEIVEMVELTGWSCTGASGAVEAGFRNTDDTVCGRISRSEISRFDPAADRFSITLQVSALTYAAALEVLASLRRGLVSTEPRRLPDAPTNPPVVCVG